MHYRQYCTRSFKMLRQGSIRSTAVFDRIIVATSDVVQRWPNESITLVCEAKKASDAAAARSSNGRYPSATGITGKRAIYLFFAPPMSKLKYSAAGLE